MYIFKIHGKEYKVRYGYRTVCENDILDRVMNIGNSKDGTAKGLINNLVETTAELLLVGLQKYHSKEFGYDSDDERQKRVDEIIDMFDDYEDESTEEHPQDASTLLKDLQNELEKNGFLSAIAKMGQEMAQMEQTAQTAKVEMENESARVIAMTPTQSESDT
jgi:hypothetical protein